MLAVVALLKVLPLERRRKQVDVVRSAERAESGSTDIPRQEGRRKHICLPERTWRTGCTLLRHSLGKRELQVGREEVDDSCRLHSAFVVVELGLALPSLHHAIRAGAGEVVCPCSGPKVVRAARGFVPERRWRHDLLPQLSLPHRDSIADSRP